MINKTTIIGCDEVGYGSYAGPLCVCGVRAPKDWSLAGLKDSKKLSAKKRDALRAQLLQQVENKIITYYLAQRSNLHIDKFGVAYSLKDAYVEVFQVLYQNDSLIVCDGILKFDNLGVDHYDKISVIKADNTYPTVMAASILAKTYRDNVMKQLDKDYPVYDWKSNVGYHSKSHLEALEKYGVSSLHRMSYAPMKNGKFANINQLSLDLNKK